MPEDAAHELFQCCFRSRHTHCRDVGDAGGLSRYICGPPQGDDDIRSESGWDRVVLLVGKVDRTLIDGEVVVPF